MDKKFATRARQILSWKTGMAEIVDLTCAAVSPICGFRGTVGLSVFLHGVSKARAGSLLAQIKVLFRDHRSAAYADSHLEPPASRRNTGSTAIESSSLHLDLIGRFAPDQFAHLLIN
jgi:hypothetical protein